MSDPNEQVVAYFVMIDGYWEFWTDNKSEAEQHRVEKEAKYPRNKWTIEEIPMTRKEYDGIMMA